MDMTTNPCLITSADTDDNTIVIKCKLPNKRPGERYVAFITVTNGDFQFNTGASANNAACPTYTTNDKVEPFCFDVSPNGDCDIHFKASASSRTFRIGIA